MILVDENKYVVNKMILAKTILGISGLGRFFLNYKFIYFFVVLLVFVSFVSFQQSYVVNPKGMNDLNWDVFYLKRVVDYRNRNNYHGLLGYSALEEDDVFYSMFPDNNIFYKSAGTINNKFKVGWMYSEGPYLSMLYPLFQSRILFYAEKEGEIVASFKNQVEYNNSRVEKIGIAMSYSLVLLGGLVFPVFVYCFLRRKKYVK